MYTIIYTAGVGEEPGKIHQIVRATIKESSIPKEQSTIFSASAAEMEAAADLIQPTWRTNFEVRYYPVKSI